MEHNYDTILDSITNALTKAEKAGLPALKRQLINGYLNLGEDMGEANRSNLRFAKNASEQDIADALDGQNCTVMFGAGKDSSFVLTVARALQLQLLKEYGTTFELRVGIGRHPGMIDCLQSIDDDGTVVDGNIEKVLKALTLHDDPLANIFFLDNQRVTPYSNDPNNPDSYIPYDVTEQNRNDVLINGHMWGGAGRRTFCDDCNKNLSRWIATALAYDGGADLYMTGDSRKELNTQIGTDIPNIMESLGIADDKSSKDMSPTQEAFWKLSKVGDEHTLLAHGNAPEDIATRHIPYENIPDRTRLITVFDQIEYDSNQRMNFFHDFLKFDFDSLMFSFTETDCGNPALMCHNIGLIADQIGSSYADGIRAYVEYAIGKMAEKGFDDELINKMRERYKDDAAIAHVRMRVEDYAARAYNLHPQHLESMVYAPFTENCKNLDVWLEHLDTIHQDNGNVLQYTAALLEYADDIRLIIEEPGYLPEAKHVRLIMELEHQTGLSVEQMRHLANAPLMMDNLNQNRGENLETARFDDEIDKPDLQALVKRRLGLGAIGINDSLYQGKAMLDTGQELPVMGR